MSTTTTTVPFTNREKELRELLTEERQRSEQRKANYLQLKDEQIKLRTDYLALQSDIKCILEETKVLKKQKEDDLEEAKKKIEQQDQQIEKLKRELDHRDPGLVEQKLAQKLREPYLELEKERDGLLRERERLLGDLKCSKQKVEHIEKEMIESIERVRLSYEVANAAIQKEKEELKVKLLEITKTPEGQKISILTEQVQALSVKLRSKEKALEDATRQYTKIQNNIENLSLEQEKALAEHERQIEMLCTQLTASREDNIKLDDIVKHLRREKDNLTRDIKRLERDQSRYQEQLLQLEQAKKVSLEQRIVELNEEKSSLKQELDNFKRLLETNGELRMNLEKEVMLLKAKIESYQSFQEEIDRLRRNQANCAEELDKVRDELVTASAMKKDLTIQLQRSEEEYNRVKMILDEERREVFEYKVESEKIVNKLKSCLEEERNEMKIRLDNLNDECKRKHKEREEMKAKCKQYASLVEKLQVEVKSLKDQVEQLEKLRKEMVPLKVYKELKRQYKELKRLLNDLPTSSLVNLSHQQQQLNQKPALFSVQSNHCKVTKTREKQTTTS